MNAVSSEDSTAAAVAVAAAAAASPEKAGMLDRVARDTAPGDMDLRPQTLLRTLCHGQPQLKIPGRRAWATSRDDEQMTVALGMCIIPARCEELLTQLAPTLRYLSSR